MTNVQRSNDAPYHDSATYHENILCLLTATHYVVLCSIGNTQQTMLPFNSVFDTGSGMNIVKRDAFFDGWEKLLDKEAAMARLEDANERPLRLLGEITPRLRFGNTTYPSKNYRGIWSSCGVSSAMWSAFAMKPSCFAITFELHCALGPVHCVTRGITHAYILNTFCPAWRAMQMSSLPVYAKINCIF